MRIRAIASRASRIFLWTVLGIALVVAALLMVLYSSWFQDNLRSKIVQKLNSVPGMEVSLGRFDLHFPLVVDIADLALAQNGDTLICASALQADVSILPLLKGEVSVKRAFLANAQFNMGNADSLMQIRIKADSLLVSPAEVRLAPLDINLIDGQIVRGSVALISKPDTLLKAAEAPSADDIRVRVQRMALKDFAYMMTMPPTIDSLGTKVGDALLLKGIVDMGKQSVSIKSFTGSRLDAAYIAPDSAMLASVPEIADTVSSAPWTVTIDSIHFTDSKGLYTTRGIESLPGLDFEYIQAYDMDITVKDFYNQATTIKLPISLHGTERCGVTLDATGTFSMDSAAMYFDTFHVLTETSDLLANGMLGVGDMTTDPELPLKLAADGSLGIPDIKKMFPAFDPYLAAVPENTPLKLTVDVDGKAGDMNINALTLSINQVANLKAKGRLVDAFSEHGPEGNLAFSGGIVNVKGIVRDLMAGSSITVPPMTLDGKASIAGGLMQGNLQAHTLDGELALDAKFNSRKEGYDIDLSTIDFPVNAFMSDLGIGRASVELNVNGEGLDVFKPSTHIDAEARIKSLVYQGYDYKNIALNATLADGKASIRGVSDNPGVKATIKADGNLDGETYAWTASIDGEKIDLQEIKMSDTPALLSLAVEGNAKITPSQNSIQANMLVKDVNLVSKTGDIAISNVRARFLSSDSSTMASIVNRDLMLLASSPMSVDSLIARMDISMQEVDRQIRNEYLQMDSLQAALPKFNIYLTAGYSNFINDILAKNKMMVRNVKLSAKNDSEISMNAQALGFRSPSMTMDTIGLKINQDNSRLEMVANVDNRPGTMDRFAHLRFNALADSNKVAVRLSQKNIQEQTGFDIGAIALWQDSTLQARLFPLNPTIGYKKWTVNLDNIISYNFPHRKVEANLKMRGEKSAVQLYTVPDTINNYNDIVLKLSDIHLADWIVINPFAPPINGDLSADLRVDWDGDVTINGAGNVALANFTYGKQRVGDFLSNLDISTNASGMIKANADLFVNDVKTLTLNGVLNDSTATSPFDLDMRLIQFPLSVVNPFMEDGFIALRGTLNGDMCVTGDAERPLINGEIYFTDAAVKLAMTGTDYTLSDVHVPVKDNLISFNNFGIYGANDHPLLIDGTVDVASMTNPKIDLSLKADNMMLVNTSRAARGADIYGKGYVDLDASAKGNMRFLDVNANLTLLTGSNLTYVLSETETMLQNSKNNEGMVKFVNFEDSAAVSIADSITESTLMMALDASLAIQNGVTITVDLSTATRDKVVIQPEGKVFYTMSPVSDGRLTGRININGGMARYTIPVVGQEKRFTFDEGSYVAFNGDMFNPVLNIHATDQVKTNVTQEGQNSRLVNFDILLGVTGTLEVMNVKFDLTTRDDLTVANELQGMSAEQRANQAMNLLLYNVYTGPGTKASANIGANPLFSFLESQVNNWMASNIKGVDISFGIDQYNQTTDGTTSQAMNYSYQVSKTLFNDRFKIVVGGNYSTDTNSEDNLSQTLINDISFEYYLNKNRTMLIKLFRHTGYESILEGEITQTGFGFVYKKRISRLSDMLPRFMRPKRKLITNPSSNASEK